MATHRFGHLLELDFFEIGVDRALLIGLDRGAKHTEPDRLCELHHAPLLVADHQIDHGQPIAKRGLELLEMKAHRTIADDANDFGIGLCDLSGERLRNASAQHAKLERRQERIGPIDLREEARPDGGIASVENMNRVVAEEALAGRRHLGAVHRARRVLKRHVELTSDFAHGFGKTGRARSVGLNSLVF